MTNSRQASPAEAPKLKPAKGRRRFLGAGAAATPVLMSIASQPALGATCFTRSRSLSKNTSISQQGKYGECSGVSPGNYKTQTNPQSPAYNWPAAPTPSTKFHPLFSGSYFTATLKAPATGTRILTLLEVLSLPKLPADVQTAPSDPSKLAKHLIAAYLNVQKGLIPAVVLDSTKVLNIWAERQSKGYFEPMAGVKWYDAEIVIYLKSTEV